MYMYIRVAQVRDDAAGYATFPLQARDAVKLALPECCSPGSQRALTRE